MKIPSKTSIVVFLDYCAYEWGNVLRYFSMFISCLNRSRHLPNSYYLVAFLLRYPVIMFFVLLRQKFDLRPSLFSLNE